MTGTRLIIVSKPYSTKDGLYVDCLCLCGTKKSLPRRQVLSGRRRSCGCLGIERIAKLNKTHGLSRTKEYSIWCGMIQRCTNKKRNAFHRYGGRGISVSSRWRRFENFLSDMGACPKGKTLERIDNNKGYSKENCTWADMGDQSNNKVSSRFISVDCIKKTVAQWSAITGISRYSIYARLNRGLTGAEAIWGSK